MFFCLKIVQDLQKMCALLSNESPCELNINQKHDILNQYFQNQMARARWFWDSYLDFTEFSEMQALKMETSVTTEKLIGILWKWAFRTTYEQGAQHQRQNYFNFVLCDIFHGFSFKILFSFPLHWWNWLAFLHLLH